MSAGDYSSRAAYLQQQQYNKSIDDEKRQIRKMLSQYDPNNIPGSILAQIGRNVIEGAKSGSIVNVKATTVKPLVNKETYTNIEWLNKRINEVCEIGKSILA